MRLLLSLILILLSFSLFAQSAYDIHFKVTGWKDTTAYLANFYGEYTSIKDTAVVDANGEFRFTGTKRLDQGMYILVLNKTRMFDFVVGHNQKFKITTNSSDYIGELRVAGDDDNELFFKDVKFSMKKHRDADPLVKIIRDTTVSDKIRKEKQVSFNKIRDEVFAFQDEIIRKNPTTVTARILKANKAVVIPDPPKRGDGSIDSTFQLRWYREHFFDNFDLADDALLRLPGKPYQRKVYEYLDRLFAPEADTLKKAISFVISKAKNNPETYKYAVWICMVKYQYPEIMGLDEIYVHMYDTYFASGEMNFWASDKTKKTLKDEADRMQRSLVGRIGKNLIMQDVNLNPRSMYDITNKYTVLFIFDPDCPKCKEETPKLVDLYNDKKFDLEVYAVSLDSSMAKMRKLIETLDLKWVTVNGPRSYVGPIHDLYDINTTPSLYILDNKRKIIAKKIGVDQVAEFLTNYEKHRSVMR